MRELGVLIDAAILGEEIIVERDDHSAVRLVPVERDQQRNRPQFGSARGLITISDDFDAPLEEFREYME